MSRRRKLRRAEKARRHLEPPRDADGPSPPSEPRRPSEAATVTSEPQVVVRKADFVVRLAYTRTQAAQALGISPSTLRRLLPYVETIEMPWGGELIPVDEFERIATERRQAVLARRPAVPPGRKPSVPPRVIARISAARAAGRSFRKIAADPNASGTPTVHGGRQWWPSTVRAVLQRAARAPAATSADVTPTYTDRAMVHTRSSELGPAARPVAVPEDLDDPSRPKARGRIELPLHIRWSGPPITYDLDDPADRARVYEQVLREGTEDDVRYYVDTDQLRDLWDELVLPPSVRSAWAGWFRRHSNVA
jgi:hypothetical protein